MREQLIQYVQLLFAGAADCEDVKEEILQNMETGNQEGEAMFRQRNRVRYMKDLLRDIKKALDSRPAEG